MIDLQDICFITVTITCGYETPVFSINLFGVFFQLLKGHGHNLSWKFFNFIFQFKCWQSFTIKEFVMVNQNWMSGKQLQITVTFFLFESYNLHGLWDHKRIFDFSTGFSSITLKWLHFINEDSSLIFKSPRRKGYWQVPEFFLEYVMFQFFFSWLFHFIRQNVYLQHILL